MAEHELIAAPEYQGLSMVVSPAEALKRLHQLQAFVKEVMQKGIDYGLIPGTGDRPTLLQPGAQKLEEIYGFSHRFEDLDSTLDWGAPFFFFRKRCVLESKRDGSYVADGIGSCNSREDRYAYRWLWANEIPKGVDVGGLKAKDIKGKGGQMYKKYRMANDDVCSLVNTMDKIACKRALVHAVIGATRSSGLFTQDVEDLPPEAFGKPIDAEYKDVDDGLPHHAPKEKPAAVAPCEAQARAFWNHLVGQVQGEEEEALAILKKCSAFVGRDKQTHRAEEWGTLAMNEKWLQSSVKKYNESATGQDMELFTIPGAAA